MSYVTLGENWVSNWTSNLSVPDAQLTLDQWKTLIGAGASVYIDLSNGSCGPGQYKPSDSNACVPMSATDAAGNIPHAMPVKLYNANLSTFRTVKNSMGYQVFFSFGAVGQAIATLGPTTATVSTKTCPAGQSLDTRTNMCVTPAPTPTPDQTSATINCPSGQTWSYRLKKCVVPVPVAPPDAVPQTHTEYPVQGGGSGGNYYGGGVGPGQAVVDGSVYVPPRVQPQVQASMFGSGLPTWALLLGGAAIIGAVFYFKKKRPAGAQPTIGV